VDIEKGGKNLGGSTRVQMKLGEEAVAGIGSLRKYKKGVSSCLPRKRRGPELRWAEN